MRIVECRARSGEGVMVANWEGQESFMEKEALSAVTEL